MQNAAAAARRADNGRLAIGRRRADASPTLDGPPSPACRRAIRRADAMLRAAAYNAFVCFMRLRNALSARAPLLDRCRQLCHAVALL